MAESIKNFIIRDKHGETKEQGSFSVVGDVHVIVEPGYGEPTATSEYVNGVLTITISNIEGNGITEITTNSQEGDEAVNTITIKTNANPEGVTLEVRNGGTGPQGPAGPPGADRQPVEEGDVIISHTKGNSEEMVMSQRAVTDALYDESLYSFMSVVETTAINNTYINASGLWTIESYSSNRNSCCLIPVNPGDSMRLSKADPANPRSFSWGWLASNTIGASGTAAAFVDGATAPYFSASINHNGIVVVPDAAHYLYIRKASREGGTAYDVAPKMELAVETKGKLADIIAMNDYAASLTRIDAEEQKYIVNSDGVWKAGSATNTCKLLPVIPGRLYKIRNNPATNGNYHAFFLTNDTITVDTQPSYAGGITVMPSWRRDTQFVYAPEDARFLYCRVLVGGSSVEAKAYECKMLNDVDRFSSERFLMQQARMVNTSTNALCFLHASDIHGDDDAVEAIKYVLDKNGDLIDDSIMTGDVVHYYASGNDDKNNYPHGYDWWRDCGLPERMLFTIGNHDGATKGETINDKPDGSAAWNGMGWKWDQNNYLLPYKDTLGYNFPEGYDDENSPYFRACYWYKDYPTHKIRLIGLDVMHRFDGILLYDGNAWTIDPEHPGLKKTTDEQEQWLLERLNETLPGGSAAGYKVVIAAHYPLDDFDGENTEWDESQHKWVCNWNDNGGKVMTTGDKATNWHAILNPSIQLERRFCLRNRVPVGQTFTKGEVNNIGNILEDFITRGGTLIAWLCGHVHAQLMYYPAMFPNVLTIAVSQTGWYRPDSNIYRKELSHERACMNFIAFHEYKDSGDSSVSPARPRDPRRDEYLIRIVRIGCKADKALAPQNVITYDWKRRKVISEW